ncbi:ogr/Delta-like zinc finger family protein [Halomonas binhaiensis]|uniref:Ogr/Delta-like zinc finger family protein n=1 Tax=Halomonas binhaiensis TaxID=2562282 RepID=A0A5C1NAZ9_9GAMM|nr:ogr/Delta-like zinc finger family protein [Halomonas binhaiensis]QEM80191.1 ogr/Delta-like zinc finger family protein [Halomonas binhaiensis]
MRITCPHCQSRTITRSSRRPVPVFIEAYAQCINPDCGWAGKLQVEVVLTTSPSRCPNPEVAIALEPRSRQVLLDQLQSS